VDLLFVLVDMFNVSLYEHITKVICLFAHRTCADSCHVNLCCKASIADGVLRRHFSLVLNHRVSCYLLRGCIMFESNYQLALLLFAILRGFGGGTYP